MKFSIVVPVYNAEQYLTKCIDSILAQTFGDFEIVMVDDGSSDKSADICDAYAAKDSRVHVIHQENRGVVGARKAGTLGTSGDYVLHVDSDDYIAPTLLEEAAGIIDEYAPNLVAFDYHDVTEDGSIIRSVQNDLPKGLYTGEKLEEIKSTLIYDIESRHFNIGCLIYGVCSKFVKRELITECQVRVPDSVKNGDDMAVIMQVMCKAERVYIDKFYGYYYLQRSNSIVHSFEEKELGRVCELVAFLRENTDGIPDCNITAYAFRMTLGQFIKAARAMESYGQFIAFVKRKCAEPAVAAVIRDFQQKNLALAGKLVCWTIKCRFWLLFWLVYHRK